MINTLNLAGMYRLPGAILLLLVVASTSCVAAEIDSVTTRKIALSESRSTINRIFDQRIKEGIDEANRNRVEIRFLDDLKLYQDGDYCDEEVLYRELRQAIFGSATAVWGLEGYQLDSQLRTLLSAKSYSLPLNDSIYRDIDYIEGFSLNLKELSDVLNIDGNLVGVDKIGHFFAEGWRYFEMIQYDGKSLHEALNWGKQRESGLFGYTTTGIFSYADLVANFNGMRFWIKVLHKQDDPLQGVIANLFERPYVTCDIQVIDSIKAGEIVKAWEYHGKFDIADFIDGAWDEGNNCNSYADPIIEEKVAKRIDQADPNFSCPYHKEACSSVRAKYEEFSRFLLHPDCLGTE